MCATLRSPDEGLRQPVVRRPPVCAGYASVHAYTLEAADCVAFVPTQGALSWALGVTSHGDSEVLGVWASPVADGQVGLMMAAELGRRGMQSLDVLVDGVSGGFRWAVLRSFPLASPVESCLRLQATCLSHVQPRHHASVVGSLAAVWRAPSHQAAVSALRGLEAGIWQRFPALVRRCHEALDQLRPFWRLAPQSRLAVLRGEALAGRLQARASAALRRHGPFESGPAATEFAETWLRAAQRRSACEAVAAPRRPRRSPAAASSAMSA
jgi:transposase-like protein